MTEQTKRTLTAGHELDNEQVFPSSVEEVYALLKQQGCLGQEFWRNSTITELLAADVDWRKILHMPLIDSEKSRELSHQFIIALLSYQILQVVRGGLLSLQFSEQLKDAMLQKTAELILSASQFLLESDPRVSRKVLTEFAQLVMEISHVDPDHKYFYPVHKYSYPTLMSNAMTLKVAPLVSEMREEEISNHQVITLIEKQVQEQDADEIVIVGVASSGAMLAGIIAYELKKTHVANESGVTIKFSVGLPGLSKDEKAIIPQLPIDVAKKNTTLFVTIDDQVVGRKEGFKKVGTSIESVDLAIAEKITETSGKSERILLDGSAQTWLLFRVSQKV